jgi:regulator of cell morphogenesis and NO signaling
MELINKTITEIVSEHNSAAKVFDKYHLDFCCEGDKILQDAVKEANIAFDFLLNDLELAISGESDENIDFTDLTVSEVSEIIRNDYHDFLRHKISEISTLSQKVLSEAADERLLQIRELIMSMFNHLAPHMLSEEKVLFPYLEYMEHTLSKGKIPKPASFGKLKKSVSTMLDDHEASASQLDELRELTNNYTCDNKNDDLLLSFYKELKDLDQNLRMHIFIENNVLFKKARALEDLYTKSNSL